MRELLTGRESSQRPWQTRCTRVSYYRKFGQPSGEMVMKRLRRDRWAAPPNHRRLTPDRLPAERVADPDEVIHRSRRQAQPNMQIELLMGRRLVRRPEMRHAPWPSRLRLS